MNRAKPVVAYLPKLRLRPESRSARIAKQH